MSQETDFYKELDRSHRKEKDKTLSAWSLTLFFVVFIALAEGLIFYMGSSLRVKVDSDLTAGKNIEGMNLVVPPKSTTAPIYIPEGVLCSQVAKIVKNEVKCSISPENFQLSGKISGLLPANASAFFVSSNLENEGKLVLDEVKIGKISTFKFLGAPLNLVIDKAIKASVGSNIRIKRIDLESGIMVILAEPK